jgi:hypothetical protein
MVSGIIFMIRLGLGLGLGLRWRDPALADLPPKAF